MGITGLLPFLEKASEKIHVESLANKTVAIDSYCWLHKGAFGVGDKLARGEETDAHIVYCLRYVNMLLSYKIKPILVFDGRHLPAKADTEAKRRESRKNARKMAAELMRKGRHNEARSYLRRCVDVTHEMALQLIQACRKVNVDCVVAPYEADSQLAYLCKIGVADYVVTEDSDLVLFGCQRILFKMDIFGACTLVDAEKLHLAMGCREEKFTMAKFRYMCILSGCDYVDSLPGIGLVKACKFILKTEETDMMRALDKIPAYLNMRQLTVTDEYKMNVLKANATFQHMVVYDPLQRKQVRLNEPSETGTDIELCCNAGIILDDATALDLAVGNLNPFTMKRLDNWHPDKPQTQTKAQKTVSWKQLTVATHSSIWKKGWKRQTNLLATMSQPLPVRAKCKPPSPIVESDVDDETLAMQEAENAKSLLDEYTKKRDPPTKKFKIDDADEMVEERDKTESYHIECSSPPPKSGRNPFKKEIIVTNDFQSPTKITAANSSLIKNQSPVKVIDYGRLEKLSRFSRTMIASNKQNVISRFFVGPDEKVNVQEPKKESTAVEMETQPEPEPMDDSEATNLYASTSADSAISLEAGNSSPALENGHGTAPENEPPTDELNEKTDISCNAEVMAIEISDTDEVDDGIPIAKAQIEIKSAKSIPQQAKNGGRRVGLTLKNSRKRNQKISATESTSIQSKLSMFGFQKRPQAM